MLNNKVAILVPGTIHGTLKAGSHLIRKYADTVTTYFCMTFGGASEMHITGSYKNESGKIVTENITYIYAYANEVTEKETESIKSICKYIARAMDQESVAYEINNAMGFIEQ